MHYHDLDGHFERGFPLGNVFTWVGHSTVVETGWRSFVGFSVIVLQIIEYETLFLKFGSREAFFGLVAWQGVGEGIIPCEWQVCVCARASGCYLFKGSFTCKHMGLPTTCATRGLGTPALGNRWDCCHCTNIPAA